MHSSTDPASSAPQPDGPEAGRDPFPWRDRYVAEDTPWDLGRAHPELEARLRSGELAGPDGAPGAALVPGCGRGHDALALARAGWRVTALDLVDDLGPELGAALAPTGGRFEAGDALAHRGGPYNLVFEHTFFCALPPVRRPDWAALMARVTRPGSTLAVLVFPGDKPTPEGGPPHRTTVDVLASTLGGAFELERDEPLAHRIARRRWLERWAVFLRR